MNWTRPVGQGPSLFFQQQWLLMDPNWTHIYCARFSWSVTGMMMPQLELLTGWLCLPFWKVKPTGVFLFLLLFVFLLLSICDPALKAQMPSGLLGKLWYDKKDDGDVSCCLLRRRSVSIFLQQLMKEICQNVWNSQPSEKAVLWAGCPRVQVIVTHIFRAKCEQSQEASECQSQ